MKTKVSLLYFLLACGMLLGFVFKNFAIEKIEHYSEMHWLADEGVYHTEDGIAAKTASDISSLKFFIDQEGYVRPKDTDPAASQRES